MKKDIEWLKEEITEILLTSKKDGTNYFYYRDLKEKIYNAIDQLDEPEVLSQELPVIPNFVASWIEEIKKQNKSMVFAITHIYDKNEIGELPTREETRLFQWMELGDNEEVFARAWLDGYTVEEEPLYYALVKGHKLLAGYETRKHWNIDATHNIVFLGDRDVEYSWDLNKISKSEWNKLGINDSNADFVKAEDVEE